MKRLSLAAFLCLLASLACLGDTSRRELWTQVGADSRVTISVERSLYEKEGLPDFYLHVSLHNLTDHDIGVDLRNHGWLIHINQWGPSDEDHRSEINERIVPPKIIDDALRQDLLQALKNHQLTTISTKGSFDYYINFNGGRTGPDIKDQAHKYILLSIAGQLFFTDGTLVWDKQAMCMEGTDIALSQPIRWGKIPGDAFIITN